MANNYTGFSAILKLKTPEEFEWWTKYIDECDKNNEEEGEYIDHCAEMEKEGVWFRAGEGGDVEQVADSVHKFFKEVRGDGSDLFELSWADWCEKPRLNEFGGGTVVVTKHGTGWCNDHDQFECALKKSLALEKKDG